MTLTEQLPYKSLTAAKRAAKSMGFETFNIVQREGQWYIDLTPTPAGEIANAKPVASDTSDEQSDEPTIPVRTAKSRKPVATGAQTKSNEPVPQPAAKAPKGKSISRKAVKAKPHREHISTASSPVAVVWNFLSQGKNAELKRADAIAALVEIGVNAGTASTQRFKFLNASPAERKARVARYTEES